MPRITLIGYRGCGKTTVAAELSRLLECDWEDADAELERACGFTIAELIGVRGEQAFRDLETEILENLCGSPGILATGGGVVLRPENRAMLRGRCRPVVWLTAPAGIVRARLAADPMTAARRPSLSGRDPLDEVAAVMAERDALYRECADHVVDTTHAPADAIAAAIADWLEREWRP